MQLAAEPVAFRAHALRIVERKDVGIADKRLTDPRKQQAQHGVDIRNGAHGGMRAAAQALLVHRDRHTQVLDRVGLRLRVARQEVANEHAESLVKLALRFGGDRIEHDGRFARAGYACEDGDFAFGDTQRYIFKVILACPADLNKFFGHVFSLEVVPDDLTISRGQKGRSGFSS